MTATLTMLAGFSGSTVGEEPDGGLIGDANGDVFGTTLAGGAFGGGTVFELVKTAVSTPITLASFSMGSSGDGPMVGLIADANGDLFGTASAGGASNHGVGRGERSLTLGTSLRPRRRAAFSALLATMPGNGGLGVCVKHVAECGLASDEMAGLARDAGGIAAGVVN